MVYSRCVFRIQQGFSLLELMIALAMFSFALLAAIKMQVQAQHMLSDALLRSKAIYLASSQKEILFLTSAANPAPILQQHWQSELHSQLPEVQFSLNKTEPNTFVFSWRSQHSYSHCFGQTQDCLNL